MNTTEEIPDWYVETDLLNVGVGTNIKDIGTLDGRTVILKTHDHLVEIWKDSFYNLGVIKEGYCYPCCRDTSILHEPKEVIVQVGAFLAGIKVGFCVQCIFKYMQIKKPNYLVIHLPFQTSGDIHIVRITPNGLKELVRRESQGKLDTEPDLPVSEPMKESIKSILSEFQPLADQMEKEEEKIYLCKICRKIDLRYFIGSNQ